MLDVGCCLFSFIVSDETKKDRGHGLHGLVPDRGRDLAAHSLHSRAAAAGARCLLHRGFGAPALQSGDIRSKQRV